MLSGGLSHDVIAAHEAGHVVTALHLGLTPVGVRLVPTDEFAASTQFTKSEFEAVKKAERDVLAFSGAAGQWYVGTYFSGDHTTGDMNWLRLEWNPDVDRPKGGGVELLANSADRFEVVNSRLLQGLSDGREFVSLDELVAD